MNTLLQRAAPALAGLVLMTAASGCLDMEQTLTLRRDGSGQLDMEYSIAREAVDRIMAMYRLKTDLARAAGEAPAEGAEPDLPVFLDPDEAGIRAALKPYEPFGITIEALSVDALPARKRVALKLHFDDLAKAAEADFFPEFGFSLFRTREGNYLFFRRGQTVDTDTLIDFGDPATIQMLAPFLAGFRVMIQVFAPGAVLDTNAPRSGRYTATWEFDFDRDPNAFTALQTTDMKILFDGADAQLPQIRRTRETRAMQAAGG
ncbi:MAG: hypothetical protein JW951_09500 [Lentisphaerae bacterium]|nr:hypothetical protein [Lentisphaerota bacterium]